MTQAPSLGRIVLYMANGGVNPPYPEPGLIVHVYGDGNALAVKANSIILVSFDTYGQVLPHAMVPYSEGKEMGTWHWPPLSSPQATTVPSRLTARLCKAPAATATTSRRWWGTWL